jgi:hypothetical protein
MIYLVISRAKSNHIKVLAAFKDKKLAEIYAKHRSKDFVYEKLLVREMSMMDESPEMAQAVLEFGTKQIP